MAGVDSRAGGSRANNESRADVGPCRAKRGDWNQRAVVRRELLQPEGALNCHCESSGIHNL